MRLRDSREFQTFMKPSSICGSIHFDLLELTIINLTKKQPFEAEAQNTLAQTVGASKTIYGHG